VKLPLRGSLAWRLYALGLIQLVLLAGSVLLVGQLLRSVLRPEFDGHGSPEHEHGPAHHHGPGGEPRGGPPVPWAPLVTFFASGVLIVGGGAWFGWRWLARPLGQLAKAARSLGAGDLGTRVDLRRSDEFGDLGRSFDEMAERIQRLVSSQKELIANVSHELCTPLARIRVALDIASEGDAGVQRASLGEISLDLGELETMVKDILASMRIDLQRGEHGAQAFPLRRAVVAPERVAAERFSVRHPERRLDLAIAPALAPIDVDVSLFRRVLDNLLENANKYSPEDQPITLSLREAEGEVVFEVVDRGIGIAPEDLPRVFEPFFRSERSRARGTGGVGLGLTLARRIVDSHGARLELESTLGQGTRARVAMPSAPRAQG
jgi:two-component system OmpR family sensor kinase